MGRTPKHPDPDPVSRARALPFAALTASYLRSDV